MTEEQRLCACAPPLLRWYAREGRALPWRGTREPYPILVSEIMLQQTRAEAVRGYYARFLEAFPTAAALADAPEEQVLKLWEGLGYYRRARSLRRAAAAARDGFPRTLEGLLALPGVGPYTAAAIGSICFSLPTPAVDGNVQRLCSRLLCERTPVGPASARRYAALLGPCYRSHPPEQLTQALIELGATVCGPNAAPACERCPLAALCLARARGEQQSLPVRAQKKARRHEKLTVLLLQCGGRIAVRQRGDDGLLAGLWELPNLPGHLSAQEASNAVSALGLRHGGPLSERAHKHIFTHVEWEMRCFAFSCEGEGGGLLWADAEERRTRLALPSAFRPFLPDSDTEGADSL